MKPSSILTIDGSFGEGGGQILRNSLALSMMTGRDIRIENIRANRPRPGLRPQHLAAVRGAAGICAASVEGDEVGSSQVTFRPGKIQAGRHTIDIGTAGSITLLLQTLLPPLLRGNGPSTLQLKGGTDVPWSPPLDYLRHVLLPLLHRMGIKVSIERVRRGFNPKGGGEIEVLINPGIPTFTEFLPPENSGSEDAGENDMHPGENGMRIFGSVFISELPGYIAKRMQEAAQAELLRELGAGTDINITTSEDDGIGVGTGITLWGKGIGSSALGRKGLRAEDVGRNAARELIREIRSGCGVDLHAGDQLPIFAPMVKETQRGMRMHYSVREITGHLRSALWVLEQFGIQSTTIYQDGFQIMI